MLKNFLTKNYIYYGSSIVISRGLEYVVLLFAASYLTKTEYGDLEYYKKIIEVGSSILAFGFPTLILSYTRSKSSKDYFYFLSILFIAFSGIIVSIFLGIFNSLFLLVPLLFYALYFTGSVSQTYVLVSKGSTAASIYKIVISLLFYGIIFCSIYYFDVTSFAYVHVNYILFPVLLIYSFIILREKKIIWKKAKRYWKLFKKLLYGSFTLVVSDFANMMFLYTDIFIIKLFSSQASIDIANYSFALNIGSVILLVPMTLVQVDIEKLKRNFGYVKTLRNKLVALIILAGLGSLALFYVITEYFIVDYKEVMSLFLIILLAKLIQGFTPLYGTMMAVMKKFNVNLIINFVALAINIGLSYLLYQYLDLYGIAVGSVISIAIRQGLFYYYFKKYSGV